MFCVADVVTTSLPTVKLLEPVILEFTFRVPPTVVFPVAAVTLNLLVATDRSLVTPKVPPTVVFPVAAVTLNLLVATDRSLVTPKVPPTNVFPVDEATLNLLVPVASLTAKDPEDVNPLEPKRLNPSTYNFTSVPGNAGNVAFGRSAMITDPETPITELDCILPDM
jgi:hypothetical protein